MRSHFDAASSPLRIGRIVPNIRFDKDDPPTPPEFTLPKEVTDFLKEQAGKNGSWEQTATLLLADNSRLREKLRNMAEAPKGAVILTEKEEIDAYSRIKQIGALTEVERRLSLIPDLEAKATASDARKREDDARTAFQKAGLNPDAAGAIPGALDVEYDVRVGKDADGKAVDVVAVKRKNAAGEIETVPLEDHITEKWAVYKPILAPQKDEDEEDETKTTVRTGLRVPPQSGSLGKAKKQGEKKNYAASVLGPLVNARKSKTE